MRDLIDNNGVIRRHSSYDSFGQVQSEQFFSSTGSVIAATDPAAIDTLFGYTGRAYDDATGLQNNLHRWYDAGVGRWAIEDPIGLGGGDANLYRYVGNGSTGATDPSGLERWLLPWETGASWNPATTAKFWLRHSPGEHLRGLYTTDTDIRAETQSCYQASGEKYLQTAGNAHVALEIVDQYDPSGVVAAVADGGLQFVEGRELNNAVMANADPRLLRLRDANAAVGNLNVVRQLRKRAGASIAEVVSNKADDAGKGLKNVGETCDVNRVKGELPLGQRRTAVENKKARNYFKSNKQKARDSYTERNGQEWPTDSTGNPWPVEHIRSLKEGGDPLIVVPRNPATDPHRIRGADGLTDYQRWGAEGTPARLARRGR